MDNSRSSANNSGDNTDNNKHNHFKKISITYIQTTQKRTKRIWQNTKNYKNTYNYCNNSNYRYINNTFYCQLTKNNAPTIGAFLYYVKIKKYIEKYWQTTE